MGKTEIAALVEKINWLALYSQSAFKYKGEDTKQSKLTNSQILFLKYVKLFETPNMGLIAKLINTTPSFASRLTTQLEDIGYVKRIHKPQKRKEVFVELTGRGRKAIEKIEAPEIERRRKIAELINEGFGEDGLNYVNEIIDYMIKKYKEEAEQKGF
jgi:DNA-binding MarR family transcriptional regulator